MNAAERSKKWWKDKAAAKQQPILLRKTELGVTYVFPESFWVRYISWGSPLWFYGIRPMFRDFIHKLSDEDYNKVQIISNERTGQRKD